MEGNRPMATIKIGSNAESNDRASSSKSSGLWSSMTHWLRRGLGDHERHDLENRLQHRFRLACISREAGSGGGSIGRKVAERLNWHYYNREIVETIAQRMGISIEEAETFDELPPTRMQAWALPVLEERYAPHETYLDHLEKLVDAIGRDGQAVVIGRGAGFCLPRGWILSVRIVAPLEERAVRLAERLGVSVRTARQAAIDLDRRRDRFARLQLNVDPHDPHHYDLVLNSQTLGLDIAAQLIVKAIEAGAPPLPGAQPTPATLELAKPQPPEATGDLAVTA